MSPARVLDIDIETSPIVAHVWGLRDQNIGLNQILQDPEIIGVGYRWEGERSARYLSTWELGRRAMLEETAQLLDDADVVSYYNGDTFDEPWIGGELAREGIGDPSPFKKLDLYKIVRKSYRFPSYKLDYVAGALLGIHKLPTGGHQLWVDCLNGDPKARAKMARYCKRDVTLLSPLRDKVRSRIPASINFAAISGNTDFVCPVCESTHVQRRGEQVIGKLRYARYHCQNCGKWSKEAKALKNEEGIITAQLAGIAR